MALEVPPDWAASMFIEGRDIYCEGGRGAHDALGKKSKSELENDI